MEKTREWSLTFEEWLIEEKDQNLSKLNLKRLWKKHGNEYIAYCKECGIEPSRTPR